MSTPNSIYYGKALVWVSMMLLSYTNTMTIVDATRFFTYKTKNIVSDQAAIDMDFRDLLQELSHGTSHSFERAKTIYKSGGHSKSYASVSLSKPLKQKMYAGTKLMGLNDDGRRVKGDLLKNAEVGDDILWFMYEPRDELGYHTTCQVGNRYNPRPEFTGCLAESGIIQNVDYRDNGMGREERITTNFTYTYSMEDDNRCARQIEMFSLEAEEKMLNCKYGCPMRDFKNMNDYYGRYDFGDEFVKAAFDFRATELDQGNQNFEIVSVEGAASSIELYILLMNIKSFVIRGMEKSLVSCSNEDCDDDDETCNEMLLYGWDQAVAYYTGALEEGSEFENSEDEDSIGYMQYNFADRQCAKYGTCGFDGKDTTGTAFVNYQIFRLFDLGKDLILAGECKKAKEKKDRIVQLMMIPEIQSLLRVAHILDHVGVEPERRIVAKGAALAAAVAPIVHTCNATDAQEIYENMKIDKTIDSNGVQRLTSYAEMRRVLERNYACLGITCEDIGGIVNTDGPNEYYLEGAKPCIMIGDEVIPYQDPHLVSTANIVKPKTHPFFIVLIIIGILCMFAVTCFVFRSKYSRNGEKEFEGRNVDEDVDVRYRDDMRFQGENEEEHDLETISY